MSLDTTRVSLSPNPRMGTTMTAGIRPGGNNLSTAVTTKKTRRLVPRMQGFQNLMPNRVREVLLVSSLYDAFTFEEDGQVSELMLKEYARLNLRYAPRVRRVSTPAEAIDHLNKGQRCDLVITSMHLGDVDPAVFVHEIKADHPDLPVVLLGYDNGELQKIISNRSDLGFDYVFVWTGDARILLAIVKLVEDAQNADFDTREIGVEVIILVEDSVHFVSSYLPALYAELTKQSQSLIGEGMTLSHKVLRMRARPKILLATTYEEAEYYYRRYRNHILGIITDMEFPRGGKIDPKAGVKFARMVRRENRDVPILLQSTEVAAAIEAEKAGVAFAHKESHKLLAEVRQFMLRYFGFGPFIFRLEDGTEVARAYDLRDLRKILETVPAESLKYHAERNHFSTWLKARTEFRLAAKLRPQSINDFPDLEAMRREVINALDEFRKMSYEETVTDFDPETFGKLSRFSRIGGGSVGGKARGLAFLNSLLRQYDLRSLYPDVKIIVPPSVVIGTDFFDQFIEENDLEALGRGGHTDEEIRKRFLAARLPAELTWSLMTLINIVEYPLAVRSSSLLEDSQYQPFAGVYETYMLPNNARKLQHRLDDLCVAIKLVYASTFLSEARNYLGATPQRPEKEKMAVIIQQLIGTDFGGRYYPTMSGVATSHDYYPFGPVKPEDGVAYLALGLGKTVVGGEGGLRFCPRYPEHLPQFSSVEDVLRNAQRKFYALPMDIPHKATHGHLEPQQYPVSAADEDGVLDLVASVYSPENNAIYDGASRPGAKLVTFASILKHKTIPLPEIICDLLEIGRETMNAQVEVEFAVNLPRSREEKPVFACLQMRPLAVASDLEQVDIESLPREEIFCESSRALGNGRIEGVCDIVFVYPEEYDRKNSRETASEVGAINAVLKKEGRPYILIGPGRWGSSDPWLGIPVDWGNISGVSLVVETGFEDLFVTPSEGSHFFHNMTSFHVGYMTTNPNLGDGFINWDWLRSLDVVQQSANGLCWVRTTEPVLGLIDGKSGEGAILKRESAITPPE